MSGVDPDNGDITENPEPEADTAPPLPEEQEGAESDGLEAESVSAAGQASNIEVSDVNTLPPHFQEPHTAESEHLEADSELNAGEIANFITDEQSDIGILVGVGGDSAHVNRGENDLQENDLQRDNLEILREDQDDNALVVNLGASCNDKNLGFSDSTQAEDEQDLPPNDNVELTGAEWSLEPEDCINTLSYTGEGAEGGNVGTNIISNDEVESQQLGGLIESHRTESGSQLVSSVENLNSYTGAQGNECLHIQSVEPQHLIEDLGAASNVSDEEEWETNSLPEEEDYYYGPEGDSTLRVEGQAGNELLETEADQEIELSAGVAAASGLLQRDWNTSNHEWSDVSCPECVEIQVDSYANTDFQHVTQDENTTVKDIGCEVNLSEAEIAICQDEIFLTDQSVKDKNDSESYEPECDQSGSVTCQKNECSQSQSEVVSESDVREIETTNGFGQTATEAVDISEATFFSDKIVIVNDTAGQPPDADHVKIDVSILESSLDTDDTNVIGTQKGDTNQRTNNSEVSEISDFDLVCSNTSESGIHNLKISDESNTILLQNNGTVECDRVACLQNHVSNISYSNGAIPKCKKFQTTEKKEADHQISHSAKTLKDESSGVDSEEELLSELDATLKYNSETSPKSAISKEDKTDKDTRCEQCIRNNLQCSLPNGILQGNERNIPEVKNLKKKLHQAKQLLLERECEISRLKEDVEEKTVQYETVILERDSYQKEVDCLKHQNTDDLYLPQIKELEYTIAQQQAEVRGLKDKLSSHDSAAKRAIAALQNEMKLRIDQISKSAEEATKEKDAMVVKYAQAEHKNLEYLKHAERLDAKLKEVEKEKESFVQKFKAVKEHRTKIASDLEAKNIEVSNLHKELDKHREQLSSVDTRVKWAQNKLKAELEAHKETKLQLEKANIKIKEAKEETQQIRRDCQAMIKTYQESEEVKSNSLDKELKQKESELLANQQEKNNTELEHVKTLRELEQIKTEFREAKAQNISLKENVSKLETEQDRNEKTVNKYTEIMQRQKKEISELREKIETFVQVKSDFSRAQDLIKSLDSEIAELKINNKDLVAEMDACRRRETDKLELNAKLSRKNAELQSENTNLSNKVLSLTGELQSFKMECQDVDTKYKDISDALANEKKLREEETQSLTTKLAGKCKAVEDLTRKVEEEKDEIKTLKRKHANNVKDLTRQLQQVRRKLENYEVTSNGDKDTMSLGSRTSSNGSLNTVGLPEQNNVSMTTPNVAVHNQPVQQVKQPSPEQEYPLITEQVEVSKQVLIERIVKLQRTMARKNEKIEFMDDHVSQLVDEIQKKNRIIQNYIIREETGTMTSDSMDQLKAELSRKHNSIMGSLYSSHTTDGAMTFELSLEINRKLQAVLEDTLLKNMTLKESLDTLGQEIARLSQENRSLQLKLQGKSISRNRPR